MIPTLLLARLLLTRGWGHPERTSSYFFMDIELSEYFGRVKKMLILKYSALPLAFSFRPHSRNAYFFALYASNGRFRTRAIQ